MRPNYNYNYNYAVTPSSVQKPRSANPYIASKPYQQKFQPQSAAHYFIPGQPSVKYYPINEEESPAFKTTHSATQSANSFFVNTKTSHKQFGLKSIDFGPAKSPKSSQNWYPQNNKSQVSIQRERQNEPIKKPQNSSDQALENYTTWLHDSFLQFEKTGNIKILKQINEQVLFVQIKNSSQIKKIYQQITSQKENISSSEDLPKSVKQISDPSSQEDSSPRLKTSLNAQKIAKLKQQLSLLQNESVNLEFSIKKQANLSQELQQQLQQEIEFKQGKNLDESRIRQDNHLKQMQESIVELEEQIKVLERKNNQLAKGIGSLPFLKEWNMMFEEAKGATKLNIKLKHQISKREDLIKQLTNEDPSNNSDARSVRRQPSQSGQKPHNFKKENKISNPSTPNTIMKPFSELPHKFNEKPDSGRSNDVVIRHLSHSNRFSESKKATVNNSVDKTKQRKQSYDQKPYPENNQWKAMPFPQNLKNIGLNFIGKDVYK